jgi:hypothetical protein
VFTVTLVGELVAVQVLHMTVTV